VPLSERVEDSREALEQAGDFHQAEGVRGGRSIYHGLVGSALPGQSGELQQPGQLIGAGQGEAEEPVHVLLVQVGPALGDQAQGLAPSPEPAVEGALHVQLGREQGAAAGGERQGLGGQGGRKGVAQGMGRVGGDDEDAVAGFGRGQGGGGGAGSLADSPLAAEEAEGGEGYGSSSSSP
jgi:hypothetical protein